MGNGTDIPKLFSCIAPVAGGGMTWRCSGLETTPVFAYHGKNDDFVPSHNSKNMVNAVNNNGGKAFFQEFDNYDHNDFIDYVYYGTDILKQLTEVRRTDFLMFLIIVKNFFNKEKTNGKL